MFGLALAKLVDTRRTSSGGAGAPPPPTATRLEVSNSPNRGDCSRSQLWVGTPTKLVTRSRSISSSARSGSHLYMMTSFSPVAKQDSITGTAPVTWNSGTIRTNDGRLAGAAASSSAPASGARRRRSTAARQA
jgi:hypothetical protein